MRRRQSHRRRWLLGDLHEGVIMDWRIKGTIQRVLGHLPAGAQLHYALQRRAGGLADFERECTIKIEDWRLMMGHLRAVGAPTGGGFLEIGTGWYPTFPLCL